MDLNKRAVDLLALGVKKFFNDNNFEKKEIKNYYKVLTDKENFNVCSSCPLSDGFNKTVSFCGCNSFLEYLTEIGGFQIKFREIPCKLERDYITEALRQIIQKKRFAKI